MATVLDREAEQRLEERNAGVDAENKRRTKIGNKVIVFAGLSLAVVLGGLYVHEQARAKNEEINNLENSLAAATALGDAGVRFSGISIDRTNEVVVVIPGTSPNCQEISFNFDNTQDGWELSLDQTDAAGNVYDSAKAHDAAGVERLVTDLCS